MIAIEDLQLAAALLRNVFDGNEAAGDKAGALASYMRRAEAALQAQDVAQIAAGRIAFDVPFELPPASEAHQK